MATGRAAYTEGEDLEGPVPVAIAGRPVGAAVRVSHSQTARVVEQQRLVAGGQRNTDTLLLEPVRKPPLRSSWRLWRAKAGLKPLDRLPHHLF